MVKTLSPKWDSSWADTCCCKGHARVEHHAQQTDDTEFVVDIAMHALDGVYQVGQAFERKVLALHRNDDAVRGSQPVKGKQRQRGRAIDQHEIVFAGDLVDGGLELALALVHLHQVDLGAGQFAVGPAIRRSRRTPNARASVRYRPRR